MLVIEKGIKISKLKTDIKGLIAELDEAFAVDVPKVQFVPAFRLGIWDGKKHFFSRATGAFPTGLLVRVYDFLVDNGHTPVLKKMYESPKIGKPMLEKLIGIDLSSRQYQLEAVDAFLANERGIIKAATNAGKTEIIAEVIRIVNCDTLYLVDRKELLYQTAERLQKRLGMPVGKVGDGLAITAKVTVAMIQTLTTKMKLPGNKKPTLCINPKFKHLMKCKLLVLDECDIFTDARVDKVVRSCDAPFRLAASGTPLLNDVVTNMSLIGCFGEILYEITNDELIKMGVSSKPICKIVKIEEPDLLDAYWETAYNRGIVHSNLRNKKIAELALDGRKKGMNVLIIAREIEHIKNIVRLIEGAVFIHGSLDSKTRNDRLQKFKNREYDILVSSTITDRGVDTENIDRLILAAGGKSDKRQLQRIGRGLRAKKSMVLELFDFLDVGNSYLFDHSYKRIQTMKGEGFDVTLY